MRREAFTSPKPHAWYGYRASQISGQAFQPRHASWLRKAVITLVPALMCVGALSAADLETDSLELQVKAAFLLNFAKFVKWPGDTAADGANTIAFCVVGDDSLYGALEHTLKGKLIDGRTPMIRRIADPQGAHNCQIVFISGSEKKRSGEFLHALAGATVLTIGDCDDFAERGGVIRLIKDGKRFRFAINVDSAKRQGLLISSRLLQLAELVHDPEQARVKP